MYARRQTRLRRDCRKTTRAVLFARNGQLKQSFRSPLNRACPYRKNKERVPGRLRNFSCRARPVPLPACRLSPASRKRKGEAEASGLRNLSRSAWPHRLFLLSEPPRSETHRIENTPKRHASRNGVLHQGRPLACFSQCSEQCEIRYQSPPTTPNEKEQTAGGLRNLSRRARPPPLFLLGEPLRSETLRSGVFCQGHSLACFSLSVVHRPHLVKFAPLPHPPPKLRKSSPARTKNLPLLGEDLFNEWLKRRAF